MRQRFFSTLTCMGLAHISERPFRTTLTMLGVAVGVSASIAVGTANQEVLRSFQDAIVSVAGAATLEVTGGDVGVDEQVIESVRQVEGVETARPLIEQNVRLLGGAHAGEAMTVVGLDLLQAPFTGTFRLEGGETAAQRLEALLARDSVFVGSALAGQWGIDRGDSLLVLIGQRPVRLTIRGLVVSDEGLASAWDRLAVMDIAAAQVVFGVVGRLDRIEVVTSSGHDVERVKSRLESVLPPSLSVRRPAERGERVEAMLRSFQLNLTVLSLVGVLVGMFLIYNTVSFAVAQRRREIAILRTIGMSRRTVALLFVTEAAMLGVIGGVLGGGLGVSMAYTLVEMLGRTVSDLYAPVAGSQLSSFGATLWLAACAQGVLLGSLVSIVGALGPSLDASRTVMAQALTPGDYEVAQQVRIRPMTWLGCLLLSCAAILAQGGPVAGVPFFGYLSTLCVLAGMSCLVPVAIQGLAVWFSRADQGPSSAERAIRQIAADQTVRSPGRNAVTVSALLVGLSIMVGVIVMVRSFRLTVEQWIEQTVMADIVVAPNAWLHDSPSGLVARTLPASWETKIAAVPGIEAVDSYRDVEIDLQGRLFSLVSRDLRVHATQSHYLFFSGDSSRILQETADADGVVVSEVFSETFGIRAGDVVDLPTPSGVKHVPVLGMFYDYATDGGKMVMDRALYRRWWKDGGVTVYPVYLQAGADLGTVRQAIVQRLVSDGSETIAPATISNAELRQEILAIFDRTFTLTYALEAIAMIVAMLGIINTLITSVLERRRELATLTAIGASERQITRLILWEAGFLGLIGTAMGLVGGVLMSLILIKVINKQSFGWTIQPTFPPGVLAEAALLAMAVALLAGYWPARWAAKQPAAEGLRYE